LEGALYARDSGDVDRAIELAQAAVAASPVSGRPDRLLAEMLLARHRYAEAVVAAGAGRHKASRYVHNDEWDDLARLGLDAARAQGDSDAVAVAERRLACRRSYLGAKVRYCENGWWSLL
jgi:hypothetical protein